MMVKLVRVKVGAKEKLFERRRCSGMMRRRRGSEEQEGNGG